MGRAKLLVSKISSNALQLVNVAWVSLGVSVLLIGALTSDSDKAKWAVWTRSHRSLVILAFVVAGCIGWAIRRIYSNLYRNNIRLLFGLKKTRAICIIIPTFHISNEDHDDYNYCFKYTENSEKRVTSGPKEICSLGDVTCVSEAIQLQPDFHFLDFKVRPDQEYLPSRSDRTIFDKDSEESSFICFGSPYSNYLTERLFAMAHPFGLDKNLYHFEGVDYLVSNKAKARHSLDVRHREPLKYKADNDKDYAVIARVTAMGGVFIICAGVRFPGTHLATKYFFRNWRELYRYSEGRDFFRIFEIDTKDSHIGPLGPLMVRNKDGDQYNSV